MDSVGLAGLVGHAAFWALLAIGWFSSELGWRGIAVFLLLWVGGYVGLPHVANGAALFGPFVAVLDIAMALTIFKGDITIR